ncbi:MAG: hypothetical protein HYT08_00540 [Candidatus Levybacteria bacterium]|nr:hypothetical protein [Candidatus Levybacteria bacterium]
MKKETLINITGGVLLVGATAIGARQILRERAPNDSESPGVKQTTDLNLESSNLKEILTGKSQDEIETLKSNYFAIAQNFQNLYGQRISVEGDRIGSILDSDVESELNKEAKNNVVLGALISERFFPDKVRVSDDYNTVTFEENTVLDLNNPLNLSITAAFIENIFLFEQSLSGLNNGEIVVFYALPTPEEIDRENRDLKWLANADVNIVIELGSFAILPKDHLVKMSRILQELEVNKIPFPKEIKFKNPSPEDPGGSYYNSKTDRPFSIVIYNSTDSDTEAHEIGHFVSDAHNMDQASDNLTAHSQDAFTQMIDGIKEKFNTTDSVTETVDLVEEYANKFRMYFQDGDTFRYLILNAQSDIEKEVLLQEYRFFKELFNNREFRADGVLVKKLEDVEIKAGNIIEITDTDTERPGIFLRPSPTLGIDASYPVAWDEDEVKILEGPQYFTDTDGRTVEMWRVRLGNYFYDKFYESKNENGGLIDGWMSSEWFGRLVSN